MRSLNITKVRKIYDGGSYIGDDMVLFDRFEEIPMPSWPRRMDCMLFALCLSGKVSYVVDTVEHNVEAGDVIIIHTGQVVSDVKFSRDCHALSMMLSYDFIQELLKDINEFTGLFLYMRTHSYVRLNDNKTAIFKNYFNTIRTKIDSNEYFFLRQLVLALIRALIYELGDEIWKIQSLGDVTSRPRAQKIFGDFISLVEKNFRHERRVSWYGEQLEISPKYLSEMVKAVSHRTPNDWIDQYVVVELRVMLRNSTISIKDICKQMHFANQSFLGKYFKEHVGMSPSEYRKQTLKN